MGILGNKADAMVTLRKITNWKNNILFAVVIKNLALLPIIIYMHERDDTEESRITNPKNILICC